MVDISVIIPSCNTKEITQKCILLLEKTLQKNGVTYEIIVIDNASSDGSVNMLKTLKNENIRIICNTENVGYGKANNQGLHMSTGKYILYLNSDAMVEGLDFKQIFSYMKDHSNVGGMTVKVNLPNGSIDPASHRGFPTLWRSFCYFAGLEKITSSIPILNRLFGGYHLTYLNLNTVHEIDAPTGAFFLVRKDILDKLKGFDEDFFMYGEDLDLCFRIKELGYKIIYDPRQSVLHMKYQSGIKNKNSEQIRKKIRGFFYESMKIFYRKHYEKLYPQCINKAVYFLIDQKKKKV